MDRHIFKLVHDDDLNESFKINVEFEQYSFNLTILRNSNAWRTVVDEGIISFQGKQLEMNTDEYFKNIQEYIKDAPTNVEFSFINDVFIIKCRLENNMKIKYFHCTLQKVNYNDCVENIMEKLYSDRNSSLKRLLTVDSEKLELEKRKNILESKFNEFFERKKTDDQELYNNFVLVLNEKKKRIQHLSELLEAFRRGRPAFNPQVEIKNRANKTETITQISIEPKENISDSDPEDYSTDDEKHKRTEYLSDEDPPDINKNKKNTEAVPSTSKYDYDLLSDNSPPRHLLPKRLKCETNIENNNFNKPSTSKQGSRNGDNIENVNSETTDYKTVDDVNALEQTPDINFSTQDLLDNI